MIFGLIRWSKSLFARKPWLTWITLGAVLLGGVFWWAASRGDKASPGSAGPVDSGPGFRSTVDPKDYASMGEHFKNRSEESVRAMTTRVRELEDTLSSTKGSMKQMQDSQAQLLQELAALREELNRARSSPSVPPQEGGGEQKNPNDPSRDGFSFDANGPVDPVSQVLALARIRKIDLAPKLTGPMKKTKVAHIPAGAFAKAKLLTGVYAPVNGAPLPVLLKVESIGWGPNRSRIRIKEGFLVGKAQGDPNSTRAIIQLQTLSLVTEDGKSIEVPVNGYVTDSDGVQGVSGTYVYRMNEIIGLSATSGILSKGADAFSQRNLTNSVGPMGNVTQVLTGNAVEYSGLQVASGTLDKISEIVAKRADEITPAVYSANGKEITVVFIEGADLQGIEMDDAANQSPFQGLDVHR